MVVLSLVCEEPMHPYRMQALIKERGKDQIANVAQRNSVYQTIDALLRSGLIAVRETSREERRPERTVYEATEEGRRTLVAWMRTVLSTPAREFPDFPAALSLMVVLEPEDVRALLETRLEALQKRVTELEGPVPEEFPRVFLLEGEYIASVVRAEITWLRGVVADLRSRRLFWSEELLRRFATEWAASHGGNAPPPGSPDPEPRARASRPAAPDSKRRPTRSAATSSRRRR
jgi:DNA-binding PadR family transcriptional regulator